MYLLNINEHINLYFSKVVLLRNSITNLKALYILFLKQFHLQYQTIHLLVKHFQTNAVNSEYGSLSSMISLIKQVATLVNQNTQLF